MTFALFRFILGNTEFNNKNAIRGASVCSQRFDTSTKHYITYFLRCLRYLQDLINEALSVDQTVVF